MSVTVFHPSALLPHLPSPPLPSPLGSEVRRSRVLALHGELHVWRVCSLRSFYDGDPNDIKHPSNSKQKRNKNDKLHQHLVRSGLKPLIPMSFHALSTCMNSNKNPKNALS